MSSLEVEVESEQEFARVDICPWNDAGAVLMEPVVLGVIGETSPRGHERVVACANRIGRNVAEVRR